MADSTTPTRPESDAVVSPKFSEERHVTIDSPSGLGEHCTTERPTPTGVGPSGEIIQLGGVSSYISKPADYPHAASKLLLFLTGATGLHSINNQLQADQFAREGFLVILPDMFADDPLPGSATYKEEKDPTIIEQIKMRVVETTKSFLIDMWLARQTPEKVLPILMKFIEAVKDEFPIAVANGGGIYSVGYCFGGRLTLLLAGEEPEAMLSASPAHDEEATVSQTGPLIKAGAVAHATLVTKEDFTKIRSPLSFVCVENDQLFPDDVRRHGEESLQKAAVECEFRSYSDVPHGFAVQGEYDDAHIQAAQVEAYEQMLAWLKTH
ncbi:hypothetical protein K3495_g2404 [Podosphaera aphanis]|nr:hypothetical protein K3495_g2404 [Podosphaera aphanis]